jgi:uncharacterized protein YhbP (UPF0306 family)
MPAAETSKVTKEIPPAVDRYLQLHHVITLSTSSFTGMPHADTVVYCSDTRAIYFFAHEGTQMLRNVKDSGYVSFTIDDYTVDWRKVRELQGVGRCKPADDADEAAAWSVYQDKFGHGASRPPGSLHRILPNEMHFVDFDYATVTGEGPDIRTQIFQIHDAPATPVRGPISTTLDQLTYEAGEVIFRPGDSPSTYFVVVDGEVELRGEGYGADQTVLRLGPGKFFGDTGSILGQKGALTCHAVARTVLLAVDRSSIRDLLMGDASD